MVPRVVTADNAARFECSKRCARSRPHRVRTRDHGLQPPRHAHEERLLPSVNWPRYNAHMSAMERITTSPDVCGGRPCIRGLRIRVKDVLDLLAAGATREEILADYPYLEADDIAAVLEFAAKQNDHPVLRNA